MPVPNSLANLMEALGRVGLASLFVLGGINKMINYGATLELMAQVGLPAVELLLPMVILLEFLGGGIVAYGKRYAIASASILAVFTIATNLYFHDFWNMEGQLATTELSLFFKNIAIAGALIMFAGTLGVRGRAS